MRFKKGDVVEIVREDGLYGGTVLVRADMNGVVIDPPDPMCWWSELGTAVAVLGEKDTLLYRRPSRKRKAGR